MILQTLLLVAPTGLSSAPPGDGPGDHYVDGLVLRVERQVDVSFQDTEHWLLRDGEETLREGGARRSSSESRHLVLVDRCLETEDGRPVRVRRTFERLAGESISRFGTAEKPRETQSALVGRSIVLARGEEDALEVELEGGELPADVALDAQELGLDLDVLLPPGEQRAGVPWEIDDASFVRLFGCHVERELFPRGAVMRAAADRAAPNPLALVGSPVLMLGWPTWTGTATLLEETRTHGDEPCRVLRIEAVGRAEAGPETTAEGQLQARLAGVALISEATGRPVLATLEGDYEWTRGLPSTDPADTETRLRLKAEGRIELRVSAVALPAPSEGR